MDQEEARLLAFKHVELGKAMGQAEQALATSVSDRIEAETKSVETGT